jgi:septum site-determining protein MinC
VPLTFDIKSAQLPLVALLLKTDQLAGLVDELFTQFGPTGESPDFFDNDPMVVDFCQLQTKFEAEEIKQLMMVLQQCKLKPLAFRNASESQGVAAKEVGLIESPTEMPIIKNKPQNEAPSLQSYEVVKELVREITGPKTLVIDRPLRSGQKVYARGADLIVLAMVNAGAEVAADGHIHVYAPLRGKAMAGASGDTQARIFSLFLAPELVSIAGVYRTSENALSENIQGKAAQVRLSGDGQEKLIFEALVG